MYELTCEICNEPIGFECCWGRDSDLVVCWSCDFEILLIESESQT